RFGKTRQRVIPRPSRTSGGTGTTTTTPSPRLTRSGSISSLTLKEPLPEGARKRRKRAKEDSCLSGLQRLPEFDFVAVRIVYPGEAAVAFILALRVDLHAFFRQAVEQCIEVVDDVVHHERG